MSEAEYKAVLVSILRQHSLPALEKLRLVGLNLSAKTRMMMIGIHPGQSKEGFFDVHIHLDGPDLYLLNKAIAPYRSLFEVSCIDGRMIPDVPMFDAENAGFSVNDAFVDVCMDWAEELWSQSEGIDVAAQMFSDEGYGSVSEKPLPRGVRQ
ncbi:hypothetical protein RU07_21175 [Agrobacterium tumefaciens]|uniref:Uncharacterized protein n=1 Tax=Agrobacterium tumefaciens TaxID=358 RepID=A0A0D0J109_AGRTU|nr:hypothetical protein RU07_21175 [Agrobacterium tumefaciens]